MGTAGWRHLALVIFLVLALLLAGLLLLRGGPRGAGGKGPPPRGGGRKVGGGGGGAPRGSHHLADALHEVRRRQGPEHSAGPPPAALTDPPARPPLQLGGGEKTKRGGRPWTSFPTWEALFADREATAAYWADVARVHNRLELDWAQVREDLREAVRDDREWAGRINFEGGALRVVELVPSPHRVGEGPLARNAEALVPAEIMEALEAKPALFLFHTHPGEGGGSAVPSPTDMAEALMTAYTGRFAAELVVSPYGVFFYAPSSKLRKKVWEGRRGGGGGPPPRGGAALSARAYLATLRHVADLLGAFDGVRSWDAPWTLWDYAEMARRYGVDYVAFPSDSYAPMEHRQTYETCPEGDHETHQYYLSRIRELEAEAEGQEIVSRRDTRRVRFAPPGAAAAGPRRR